MRKQYLILLLCMALLLCACGGKPQQEPESAAPAPQATEAAPADALSALRADMKPPIIAVADFGFPTLSDEFGVMDYLLEEYPKWMAQNDFIRNMPEERIIQTCSFHDWAQLLCIVPKDPESTVTVNVTRYDMESWQKLSSEVAYRSGSGEPFILYADISETVSITVEVTDSEGRGVSWQPYWGNTEPIPADSYFGHLAMDFTPQSEKTAYDRALENEWVVPDDTFLTNHYWYSDFGYKLELEYYPGELYDGEAYIYEELEGYGECISYQGSWRYQDGMLQLSLNPETEDGEPVDAAFPVLMDSYGEGYLSIFRTEEGIGLPNFLEGMEYDDLIPIRTSLDYYHHLMTEGWRFPELWELTNSNWLSQSGTYAMDLMDDSVPGDNGGWVTVYDVNGNGAYTQSYTGSWRYENDMLYLSLVPEFGDGYLVDDTFPVLMLDGILWLGRNDSGIGLPHFEGYQVADTLEQPKG